MMIAMKRRRNTSAVAPSIQRSNNVRITPARIGATLDVDLDVNGLFFLLQRARAECPVRGRSGGKHAHLLLQLDEEHLRRLISVRCLETLEIVRQLIARKLLLDFGARPDLALVRFDLLFHAREGLER